MRPLRYFVVTYIMLAPNLGARTDGRKRTYSIILLLKVINISVQNLDKKLNRHSRIHTSICNAKCSLQTLKNTFSIAIKLNSVSKPIGLVSQEKIN